MPIVTTRADARLAITATRVAWLVGGSVVVVAAKKLVLGQAY